MATAKKPAQGKTPPKPNNNRPASQEAVVSRARRMARQTLKPLLEAFGAKDEKELLELAQKAKAKEEEGLGAREREERRITTLEAEVRELRDQKAELTSKLSKSERRAQEAATELENFKTEQEIREAAVSAGVADLDYGVELFRRHVSSQPEGTEFGDSAVSEFFEALKKDTSKRALFRPSEVEAGPRPVGEQKPNHQVTQPASGADDPNTGDDVDKMSPQQFREHTQKKYGYAPPSSFA